MKIFDYAENPPDGRGSEQTAQAWARPGFVTRFFVKVPFLAYAEAEIRRGATSQESLVVAGRSAEFHAIKQMLNKKTELKNIALTPILLPSPESGPADDKER